MNEKDMNALIFLFFITRTPKFPVYMFLPPHFNFPEALTNSKETS